HHGQVVVDLPDLVERGDAVHAWQHDVDDGRVERHRAKEVETFVRRRGQAHLVALARQQGLEDLTHDLLVVDNQNRSGSHLFSRGFAPHNVPSSYVRVPATRVAAAASGRRSENRVPWPTTLSQVMLPPCSCTIPYVIESPSPVPLPMA